MSCILKRCNGSGWIYLKNGKMLRCDCLRYQRAAEIYQLSNAPKGYQTFIEDFPYDVKIQSMKAKQYIQELEQSGKFTKEEILEKRKTMEFLPLKQVLKQFDDGKNGKPIKKFIEANTRLFFSGKPGTLKTGAAIALAYEAGKRNKFFQYVYMNSIFDLFRFRFNDAEKAESVEKRKELIKTCDILILDDFGKELDVLDITDERDQRLFRQVIQFLNEAVRSRNKLIILTSNLPMEEAKNLYQTYAPDLASVLFNGNTFYYKFYEDVRSKTNQTELFENIF